MRDDVRRLKIVALFALRGLAGCATTHCEHRWSYNIPAGEGYAVAPAQTSPGGVRFDPSGQAISGALIDRLTQEVSDCLGMSIDRSGFVVKVPANWSLSCDGAQELLPTDASGAGCLAKGLTPSDACPCRWRALIQCPNTIVATPSLYLYKDALVRWVTGSQDPWADPALARCAAPTTDALSKGAP